jgi:hypothetical protein
MIWRAGEDQGIEFYKIPKSEEPRDVSPDKRICEEYEFYLKNGPKPFFNTQLYLIHLYANKLLGSTGDAQMMDHNDLIKMIMIMKRDLRNRNYTYLPFFLNGIMDPTRARKYNRKKLEKLFTSLPIYEDFAEQFGDNGVQMNMDRFYGELKVCISCPFTAVEYESELDQKMVTPSEYVCDEWGRFMCEL